MASLTKDWVPTVSKHEDKFYEGEIIAQVLALTDYKDGNDKVKNTKYKLKISDGVNYTDAMVMHKVANRMVSLSLLAFTNTVSIE